MPADPNAGLVKAVTGLTRALEDNTKASKELTKELKARPQRTVRLGEHPYLDRTEEVSTEPRVGKPDDYVGPYGSGPSQSDR